MKLEYSPDLYAQERVNGNFDPANGFNFGVDWRPIEGVELGGYYLYGSEFGIRLTLTGNPARPLFDADLTPGALPFEERVPPADAPEPFGEVVSLFTPATATLSFPETGMEVLRIEERANGTRFAIAQLPVSADDRCPLPAAVSIDAEFGVVDAVLFQWPDGTVLCTVALRPEGEAQIWAESDPTGAYPIDWYDNEIEQSLAIARTIEGLQPERIQLIAIDLQPRSVEVRIENNKFRAMPRAVGRTARALARAMPPSVETFIITPVEEGLPVVSIILKRRNLELHIEAPDAERRSFLAADIRPASMRDIPEIEGLYPRYSWSIAPITPINAFDPDQPFRVDLAVAVSGSIEFSPGFSVSGRVEKRIIGQLDDITRPSDSELPRVRSEFAQYLREGDPGIDRLTVDYLFKLDEDIYGRFSGGLLEGFFGGASAEVLWAPIDSPIAVGAEINWSQQRDFDQLFGFQDYQVATGHVSLYWDTGWNGLHVQLDVGRYLARDWGGTFTLTRRFANGWEVGGFFTLTNVPFSEFGEGSFDRGIFINIPLNWGLPNESRSAYTTVIRPVTRDGGQRLIISNRLYPIVQDNRRAGLRRDWDQFWQ